MPDGCTNECYRCCGKYRLMWFNTVYEPGEVKAVAFKNGRRLGEATVAVRRVGEGLITLTATADGLGSTKARFHR